VPKWVIVVLVALAVLFVISLAAGSRQDRTSRSGFGDSLQGLRKTEALKLADLRVGTGCVVANGRLTVNGSCEASVGEAGRFKIAVREARLRPVPGSPAGQVVFMPADGPPQSAALTDGPNFDFSRKGGKLRFACAAGCAVLLAP
jgi:hypothetical protein